MLRSRPATRRRQRSLRAPNRWAAHRMTADLRRPEGPEEGPPAPSDGLKGRRSPAPGETRHPPVHASGDCWTEPAPPRNGCVAVISTRGRNGFLWGRRGWRGETLGLTELSAHPRFVAPLHPPDVRPSAGAGGWRALIRDSLRLFVPPLRRRGDAVRRRWGGGRRGWAQGAATPSENPPTVAPLRPPLRKGGDEFGSESLKKAWRSVGSSQRLMRQREVTPLMNQCGG